MKYFLILFLLTTTQAESARIKLYKDSPDGTILSLRGLINNADHRKLENLMEKYGKRERKVLFLHSEGGLIWGAKQLGYVVRKYGIITAIGRTGRCMSACPMIFFAGWDKYRNRPYRIKHPRGKLGLHQSYRSIGGRKVKSFGAFLFGLRRYFYYMQAGEGLFQLMERTHWKRIAYVKNRTLQGLGGYHIRSGSIIWPKPIKTAKGPKPSEELTYDQVVQMAPVEPRRIRDGRPRLGIVKRDRIPLPVKPSQSRACDAACEDIWRRSRLKPDAIELLRTIAGD